MIDFNFIRNRVENFYKLSKIQNNPDKAKSFIFQKFYLPERKLFFLSKNNIILCGDFNESSNTYYIKLYLLHMYISFTNFNETLIDRIQAEDLSANKGLYDSSEDGDKPRTISSKNSEYLQLKIYEKFFIFPISTHFENIFKVLIRKEEISLSYIKFRNMYMVDLFSQEILFDLNSFKVRDGSNI